MVDIRPVSAVLRAFVRSRSGLAAVEFALIAPVMIFMFFAVVEGSDALAVSRRVNLAANTLADLVAQETEIDAASTSDLFSGIEQIIDEGSISADFRIVSLVLDPDTNDVLVHWSRDNTGSAPYAAGSIYTGPANATMLDATSSLIVAEVYYDHAPALSRVLIPSVSFVKTSTRWPRRAFRVQFCTSSTSCTS